MILVGLTALSAEPATAASAVQPAATVSLQPVVVPSGGARQVTLGSLPAGTTAVSLTLTAMGAWRDTQVTASVGRNSQTSVLTATKGARSTATVTVPIPAANTGKLTISSSQASVRIRTDIISYTVTVSRPIVPATSPKQVVVRSGKSRTIDLGRIPAGASAVTLKVGVFGAWRPTAVTAAVGAGEARTALFTAAPGKRKAHTVLVPLPRTNDGKLTIWSGRASVRVDTSVTAYTVARTVMPTRPAAPRPTTAPVPAPVTKPMPTPTKTPTPVPSKTAKPISVPPQALKPTARPVPPKTVKPTSRPAPPEAAKPTARPVPPRAAQPVPVPATTAKPTATPVPMVTKPPQPTPTAAPVPSATPQPSASPTPTVVPLPVETGRPNAETTGVPQGTALTVHEGDLTVTTPGAVVDGLDIRGLVKVSAPNVTIKNSIIRGRALEYTGALVNAMDGESNLRIIDSELHPAVASPYAMGIYGSNFTATRLNIHGVIDGAHITGDNVTIEQSWLHDNLHFVNDPNHGGRPSHDDSIQIQVGNNIRVDGNTIDGGNNSVIQITQDRGDVSNFTFTNNYADGGGCTINIAEKTYGPVTGVRIADNIFGRDTRVDDCAVIAQDTTRVSMERNYYVPDNTLVKVHRG